MLNCATTMHNAWQFPAAPAHATHAMSNTRICPSAPPIAAIFELGAKSTVNTGFGKLTRAPKGCTPRPSGGRMKNFASLSCDPPAKIIWLLGSLLHCAAKSMHVDCDDGVFHSTVSATSALFPAPKSHNCNALSVRQEPVRTCEPSAVKSTESPQR